MEPPFSQFVDFVKFGVKRYTNYDAFLVSRVNNEWNWDTLSDAVIGELEATRIHRSILPQFARSTHGTIAAFDDVADAYDSSDLEDNEDDDAVETPGLLDDQINDIPQDDPIARMLAIAAPKFDQVEESKEDRPTKILDLIDFDSNLAFPEATGEFDRIVKDLQGIDFAEGTDPQDEGPELYSLPESGEGQNTVNKPLPINQHGSIFTTPKKQIANANILALVSNQRGVSPEKSERKNPFTVSKPSPRRLRVRSKKVTIIESDADTDDPDITPEGENEKLYESPTKKMGLAKANANNEFGEPLPPPNFGPERPITVPPITVPNLVETPTLKQLGMKFQRQYLLFLCVACRGGFGFRHFIPHAYTGAMNFSVYDPKAKAYFQPRPAPRHMRPKLVRGVKDKKTGGEKTMSIPEIQRTIMDELKAVLGYYPAPHVHGLPTTAAIREWAPSSIPHPTQKGPIEGLRIYPNAFRCGEGSCADEDFPYCAVIDNTMFKHFKAEHPDVHYKRGNIETGITVQTLCAASSWINYFEIRPGGANPSPSLDIEPSVSLQEAVLIEQKELFGDLMDDEGLDTALINPAYSAVGMSQFWETFDSKKIQALQAIEPSPSQKILKYQHVIAQAATATFLDISLHAKTANTAILHLITKGAALPHLPYRKKFNIPQISTLKIYLATEILLLRWLIHVLEHPILDRKGTPLFKFDDSQSRAIHALVDAAREGQSIKFVATKVVDVLYSLYFPSNPDRSAFDNHAEPVNVFLALLCLTDDGAPRPIPDVPHYCGRIQFSMRIRAYHYLYTTHARLSAQPTSPTPHHKVAIKQAPRENPRRSTRHSIKTNRRSAADEDDLDYSPTHHEGDSQPTVDTMMLPPAQGTVSRQSWWKDTAIPWCAIYLTENEPTPYGQVREVMRVFSASVRKHRKDPQVRWVDSNRFLLDNHEIHLDLFRSHLHYQLELLEKFICEKLLFGHTLEALGIEVDFEALNDTGDETTVWHSPLLGQITGNPDSEKFLQKLIEDGTLLNREGSELVWELRAAQNWVSDTHYATCRTQAVTHITEGSAGRITEEAKMLCANTRMGRRHLFVAPGLNTLCLWSNYWKGSSNSGSFKEILRVIPFQIARYHWILVRIIRPIILMYLTKHLFTPDNRTEVVTKYRTSLWATLGTTLEPTHMYRNIADFFASPNRDGKIIFPDFTFGARLYRQFVVTVQRKFISGNPYYTETPEQESIGDKQAGRSTQTSTQYYGVEEGVIKREPAFIDHYVNYSKKWHEYLEIPTEHSEGRHYFV